MGRALRVVAGLALVVAGATVGHNANFYTGGSQAVVGVTWGTEGGCEVGPLALTYGWVQTDTITDWAGCWRGISD